MAYVFTKDLEIGEALVDAQHKELFRIMNELGAACSSGAGRQKIDCTLKFLQDYIEKHFRDEQNLHTQHQYPARVAHKQMHDAFARTTREMVLEYNKTGETIGLLAKVNANVGTWLVTHIKVEDRKFGTFLAQV